MAKNTNAERNGFAAGFTIYMLCLFTAVAVGLALLWMRMEVYEISRPDSVPAAFIAAADSGYWENLLAEKGVRESYLETLDLGDVSFNKKWELYTEDVPAYNVRFGNTDILTISLKKGKELSFGYHEWEIDQISLGGSRLYIYAPAHAVIRIDGEEIDRDCLVQENAQELSFGLFDANREDRIGLAKYQLDTIYPIEDVTVEDDGGNLLGLSYTSGVSYYYAPFMNDYRIAAPADCSVTVNGIVLSRDNAGIETCQNKDFEGIESYIPVIPEQILYTVEGLIMPPEVVVRTDRGDILEAVVEGTDYRYDIPPEEIPAQLSSYVMGAFDAYIAYSGNRGNDLAANYSRYASYLMPGSEAAQRASKAQGSLKWISGRDAKLKSAGIKKYIPYSDDLFTCQIDFTMAGDEKEDANSYLFVFVKYNGAWKVVRVLNKTSFLAQ